MSRRRRKNKHGLAGKERNVYKQRRATASHSQRSVEEFHFDFDEKPAISPDVPIRSRNDFLPSAEPDTSTTSQPNISSNDSQLTFPLVNHAPTVMRIVKDDDQRPSPVATSQQKMIHRSLSKFNANSANVLGTLTWRGYLQGCAWGGAAAATILAVLRIAN